MLGKKVTLKDVAAKAGCSVGAVSVVIANRPSTIRVSEETRARILGVVKKIGYVPNYHAQSLHLKNSFTLGLVLGDEAHRRLANGYWAKYVSGVDQACRREGYDLLFVGPSNGLGEAERAVLLARQSRVDALIVVGGTYGGTQRRALEALRFPVVYLQEPGESIHPSVVLDEVPATRAGLERMREMGHRRLHYVTAEPVEGEFQNARLRRLEKLAPSVGLELPVVPMDPAYLAMNSDLVEDPVRGTFDCVRAWMGRRPKVTAVAFFNDLSALGGLAALQLAGRRVPEDVSVLAFDDVRAALAVPALTVVSLELVELGKKAVELALVMAREPRKMAELRGTRHVVEARLVERGSIGRAT